MAKNFVLLQVFDVIPVRELETRLQQNQEVSSLDYDFLSNVSLSIQDIVEKRTQKDILNWINANDPTAQLLADTTTETSGLNIISTNTTVGRNSFIKDTVHTITQTEFPSPRKIDIGEVASFKAGFTKIGVFEDGRFQIEIVKDNLPERSIGKISPWHIAIGKTPFIHTGVEEFSKAQVTSAKPTRIEVGVGEVGLLVNNSFINSVIPVGLNFPASFISFSSSVLSNQFFTIATNIWSDLLNPKAPLNITFQITNLPNGQLAEAQIASFDASGLPGAATTMPTTKAGL